MAMILVAEDDREVRELILFALRFAGYEVLGVSNGEDGCNVARHDHPDLVLMDVRMPRMDGYEACKILKSDPSTASIPVVFLSARGQETEVQAGLEAGGDDYIVFFFSDDATTEKVRLYLQKGRSGGEKS